MEKLNSLVNWVRNRLIMRVLNCRKEIDSEKCSNSTNVLHFVLYCSTRLFGCNIKITLRQSIIWQFGGALTFKAIKQICCLKLNTQVRWYNFNEFDLKTKPEANAKWVRTKQKQWRFPKLTKFASIMEEKG